MNNKYVEISKEVALAIEKGLPVIALESTIISHGMPYPKNKETALNVEKIVRENGCIPATIGIINGKIKVGLSNEEIDLLAIEGLKVAKVSRRDLAYVISNKLNGATTVATTMIGASLAGIKIFATGGIGGVHRDGQNTMDISADLEELAKTNVAVVCAGAKSILDLGLTLEYLETKGVPVLGYKTKILPAFYTSTSNFELDYNMNSSKEIADLLKAKWELGLNGGVVIANPIPKEYEMPRELIDSVIEKAVNKANELGVKGKNITPFLLDEIQKVTSGKSLDSNIELVYNNVKLACKIAKNM
ncbi:pseudouridine-5'-phosphate glycosidase [Oceanivirga miroungae]|uniref:Pseudouridine-5'-phosphate glycosidase n=1 Tax=Oceanivirga miroungae TaxID=1130046 RepID=A0A6I8MCP2_9FUSO|nr:pseudouridine-5'-phosphate glycosidase [Oceanivirga miroungae]VWL84899.1 Pseudouridine-5'-phosphate glycosidase [Oceanivirga miroungae]